jgi:glycosyltransferase involved in cell wall biosynthesis
MKPLVSVVVPFYNEEENVRPLADRVAAVFSDSLPDYDHECIFVNDGSTDGTRGELNKLALERPTVRPLHLKRNRGQSAALVAGLRQAQGAFILTLDGDLQNDPADFPKFLELLQQYDCVCGVRANRNDSWLRRVSSRVANKVRNAILHDGIQDAGCGSKGFRRSCIPHILPFNGVHRFLAVMVRNGGLSLTETPVTHHPRTHGVSKYGLHNRLWRGIYDLFGVAWLAKRYVTWDVEGGE